MITGIAVSVWESLFEGKVCPFDTAFADGCCSCSEATLGTKLLLSVWLAFVFIDRVDNSLGFSSKLGSFVEVLALAMPRSSTAWCIRSVFSVSISKVILSAVSVTRKGVDCILSPASGVVLWFSLFSDLLR